MSTPYTPSASTPYGDKVIVCQHPLLAHHLTLLRDQATPCAEFRASIKRVAQFVMMEATKLLPTAATMVETPICKTQGRTIAPDVPLIIVPILRAGLMMGDIALDWMPHASVYHVGLQRDEETLEPSTYYNKLPAQGERMDYSRARLFIVDPMLATGGSAVAAINIISKLGVAEEHITFASILAAPEGIEQLRRHYPNITIVTGALDEKLNQVGYIVPGLGDAGDRSFGTL
ncbi:MAG: uracil phosphoribosyltransferase [Cyanobacteria bacterium HKST-UBA06]|nr:uracil phosphoribosyltransferase [Cyanobacteria bacterium HKST-UBA04]MCA9807130.1 uracil phosphoribosyltransferase [Cyanobacteria bacterium HKST-UBA06]MCA9840722.1 uracil phosphoribosyltransferase [Cyanobacteria bacterium HKST-UBA03]